ncbi:MAG: amino acid permease [Proteobacteria bacterium]|nr:amino acid permease [Pseudomonadota bacterium]
MTDATPRGSAPSFSAIEVRETGLRRELSSRQLAMIAIGGAIGTGLFLGSGFAIGTAGPSVLLSYAIGALISLLLMGCLAEMTVAHPTTGSFGAYAEHYLGPLAGFLVRYAYATATILAVGTEVTAVALYMRFWLPDLPGWPWILGYSAALIAINAAQVGWFGRIEYVFSLIKVAAIIAFIGLAAYVVFLLPDPGAADGAALGLRNYRLAGGFFPHGAAATWVAVIIAVFSYLSIEMIAVAAGEAADPATAITRAFRSTVVRLILFYLLTLALMLAVVPWTAAGSRESPFVTVMRSLHIPGAAGLMNFVVLVAALSAMNSQLYVTTRMLFSLARAGHAPRALGSLSARGIPVAALIVSSAGVAVATIVSVIAPEGAFLTMLAVASFGAMFTWMMIFVTHFAFRRRQARDPAVRPAFRMRGFPATTLLGAGLMAALLLTTPFTDAFRMTLVFGLPFLGLLCLAYVLRRRSASTARAD